MTTPKTLQFWLSKQELSARELHLVSSLFAVGQVVTVNGEACPIAESVLRASPLNPSAWVFTIELEAA